MIAGCCVAGATKERTVARKILSLRKGARSFPVSFLKVSTPLLPTLTPTPHPSAFPVPRLIPSRWTLAAHHEASMGNKAPDPPQRPPLDAKLTHHFASLLNSPTIPSRFQRSERHHRTTSRPSLPNALT